MKKLTAIITFLLFVSNIYAQDIQEIRDKYNKFNAEFPEAYGKDYEKSIKLLDELYDFYNSISSEYKSDSTLFYCQVDLLYCNVYNLQKEYDKAVVYVKKLQSRKCDNLYSLMFDDSYSELRKHEEVQKVYDQIKNTVEYRFQLVSQKINKSVEDKDYKQSIENVQSAFALYDSLENKKEYILCQLNLVLSMSYSALNDKPKAIESLTKVVMLGCEHEQFVLKSEFNGIRNTKEFRELIARDITLTAPELSPGAWGLENGIPVGVFSDNTCSALKEGIKESDIDAIKNPQFKALAKALYDVSYDKRYRVREYKPYPHPSVAAEKNRTGTYSLLDNATGIVAMPGEEIIVFVGETNGQDIGLCSINFNNDYSPANYKLKEGANSVICAKGGLLYVMYHTQAKEAQPIKVHIASGKVNGMYHIEENTNLDWEMMLDSAKHKYIDVQGEYSHLIFRVKDFKQYTPDISRLIAVYDSIVYLESRFIGLEKYKRMNGNRMLFHVSASPLYWMYATSNRTGYSTGAMPRLCDVDILRSPSIWGPAHEVGHINQTRGLKWVGLTEVSNNIYAQYVRTTFGNKANISSEELNSDFDGVWSNRYEKGFTEVLVGKKVHSDYGDVFGKLIPFWQLQLYFSNVKGETDFYADVHEEIRNLPQVPDDGQQQLNFMRICCDVSKTDLSEFFERWGMLVATAGTATDHSSVQNRVYYKKEFNITKEEVDALKRYASKYPKPDAHIWYIHDECVAMFKNNADVEKGNMTVAGVSYEVDAKNAVVYEVYDGDELVFVTPVSKFKIPVSCKNPVIYAVSATGKSIKME